MKLIKKAVSAKREVPVFSRCREHTRTHLYIIADTVSVAIFCASSFRWAAELIFLAQIKEIQIIFLIY